MEKLVFIKLTVVSVISIVIFFFIFNYFFTTQRSIIGGSSQIGNLSAGISTFISCTWSNAALDVSFGTTINPGVNDINATQNYNQIGNGTAYNVTVDVLSNVNVDLLIKGENLVSGVNVIGIGNVSWMSNTSNANGTNMIPGNSVSLNTSYNTINKVASNRPVGSSTWYRFWFDIPQSQVAGAYNGNYSQQCQQAA